MYADADVLREPAMAGRSMNSHFASRYLTPEGAWKNQTEMFMLPQMSLRPELRCLEL